MANYRAVANGNWSSGATWGGGSVPPNGEGHNIYSNNFTVTIDQNVDVALITNAAITASFVGGGTSAAVGGGFNCSTNNLTLNLGNISLGSTATSVLTTSGTTNLTITANIPASALAAGGSVVPVFSNSSTGTITFTGNVNGGTNGFPGNMGIQNQSSGTINIYGNLTGGIGNSGVATAYAVHNSSTSGTINVYNGTISAGTNTTVSLGYGVANTSTGVVNLYNCIINAGLISAINNSSTGTITAYNCVFSATNSAVSYMGGASSVNRLSGTFVNAPNGTQAIGVSRWFLFSTPSSSYFQIPLDGTNSNSFVRYFTADNSLGQAAPTDVRSGVTYASGNLTGRLTIPARGTVANGVTVGPNMPFTATRSGTTATATLTYSYPYQVGDVITVTGASNSEWNMDYTIASVISGTSVTFAVPDTHSATAGTGANMQTKGTAVLEASAVAAAVWGAATSSLITAGSIGERLKNAATVDSTGTALAVALTAP